ncbi:MAG: PQQ-binding-like beta-propeller repeat protein [Candidatus Bathyarchaeota archaeon]|nr:PQQ-binding-like beta-propeller repeat protein [Candidatus Bathyarchaeota archaeon]MDH5595137.1 PQQ-binding-like beta-propeller repeat protein [Candidatus Bathyarchaeota archaeon]
MVKISSKTKTAAIALVLMMASVTLMAVPVNAQQNQGGQPLPPGVTPAYVIETRAFLSFRPNPVGLDQVFLVNLWTNPALHRSRYHTSYVVKIQKPDGTNVTVGPMDSYPADTTAWFEYVAGQIGVWKLKFEFGGSYFPDADVPGGFMEPPTVHLNSTYYEPSSTEWQELTVQTEQVLSWPPSSLPTDYWTRPISPENREWWSISGYYPWRGPGGGADWPANTNKYWSSQYSFEAWVQAPNTAHIVWKRQTSLGGLIGRITAEQTRVETFGGGFGGGGPSVIYQGRCYQSVTLPGGETVLRCYDLRTGETYWEISPDPTPTSFWIFGAMAAPWQLEYSGGAGEVSGAQPQFGVGVSLVAIGGGRLIKLDPWSGVVTLDASIAPLDSGTYYRNGYALSVQNIGTFIAPDYRLINWTTFAPAAFLGAPVYNFTASVISNITWPLGDAFTVAYDFEAGMAGAVDVLTPPGTGIWYGTRVRAASLKDGTLLWDKTVEETNYSPMCALADHGKVAFLTMGGYWLAYNLNDGSLAWKSDVMDYPWDAAGWGAYAAASAYGLFYRNAYSGVYAFNWTNGKIVWKYKAPTPNPYETPYIDENGEGVYSFNGGGLIADGKYYAYNTEHTPTQPLTRGWKLHCINATTGDGIWNITGSIAVGATFGGTGAAAVADGYLVGTNSYDGYMYCFGRGRSQTTVSASPEVIAKGSSVLIKGTVLDQSPAQPGTPCVSKESMATYMEYLHMQKPIPDGYVVTGVPVTLLAIGSDGNVIDIGTVKSDLGGFRCEWTPPDEDLYTITASFMGDDSYGSSWAATASSVGPAPEPVPEYGSPEWPAYPEAPAYTAIDLAIIAAVVVVALLVIFDIVSVRKLRK